MNTVSHSFVARRRPTKLAVVIAAALQFPLAAMASEVVLPRIDVVAGGEQGITKQPGSVAISAPPIWSASSR